MTTSLVSRPMFSTCTINKLAVLALSLVAVIAAQTASTAHAEPNLEPLKRWLAFQSGIDTLKTNFVQDRKLKTMRHPFRDEGTFWLDHPNYFRWQIDGDPPKMIAIRDKNTITLLKPGKKEAEQVTAGSGASPALDFLAEGFPRSIDALLKKFDVTEMKQTKESWEAHLKPKDIETARTLSKITFFIEPTNFYLQGFELNLKDGSNIRTYFTRQVYNESVDASLFKVDLNGYTVTKQ